MLSWVDTCYSDLARPFRSALKHGFFSHLHRFDVGIGINTKCKPVKQPQIHHAIQTTTQTSKQQYHQNTISPKHISNGPFGSCHARYFQLTFSLQTSQFWNLELSNWLCNVPVMAIFADHLDVPSRTLCLTWAIDFVCVGSSIVNTFLFMQYICSIRH